MEAGQILVPEDAPWVADFIAELLAFPHGTHDDQVDMLSYAVIEMIRTGKPAATKGQVELQEYVEKELAAEAWNRIENPLFWVGDGDD